MSPIQWDRSTVAAGARPAGAAGAACAGPPPITSVAAPRIRAARAAAACRKRVPSVPRLIVVRPPWGKRPRPVREGRGCRRRCPENLRDRSGGEDLFQAVDGSVGAEVVLEDQPAVG